MWLQKLQVGVASAVPLLRYQARELTCCPELSACSSSRFCVGQVAPAAILKHGMYSLCDNVGCATAIRVRPELW